MLDLTKFYNRLSQIFSLFRPLSVIVCLYIHTLVGSFSLENPDTWPVFSCVVQIFLPQHLQSVATALSPTWLPEAAALWRRRKVEGVGWQQQAPPSGSMTFLYPWSSSQPTSEKSDEGQVGGEGGRGGHSQSCRIASETVAGRNNTEVPVQHRPPVRDQPPVGPSPLHTYQHLWSTYCDPAGVKQGTRILVKHSHCPREPEFHVPFSFILPHNWKHHPDIKMSPFLPFQKPLKGKAVEEKL